MIDNIGAGLAPWNLANYQIACGRPVCNQLCVDGVPVIFYHAHEFGEKEDGSYRLTNYHLRPQDITAIYDPYLRWYEESKKMIAKARTM